ncbi:MAG: hypothetical protein SH868_06295 [Bythopirellula sp.]|nr:hypothetical protein [Bythopirellula sp.]
MARLNNPLQPIRWLTVDAIRKQQRMRRETVLAAMLSGELPYEQRGRIRYARVSDVEAWEERRLSNRQQFVPILIHPDLAEFAK